MIRPNEHIVITGRLSADPNDIKDKATGEAIGIKFSVPIGHGYKDKESGTWVDTGTTWFDIAAFGETAETLRNAGLYKGQFVRVQSNEMKVEAWKDKEGNPQPRVTLKIWDGDVSIVQHKPKNNISSTTTTAPTSLRDEENEQLDIDFDTPPGNGKADIPF